MKSHLQSYPCPLIINYFWNLGFLLGITILLQIISGIFLGLHYTSDINSAYFSIFFIIREIYYGWCLRYLHSNGSSFVFLFIFLHLGRAISYGSYFYNPNTWFSGIIIIFFLMVTHNRSTAPFPRIIPVDPPTVNINKKRCERKTEVILRCNNGGLERYVKSQLKIFVPVGKDIKIVTPVK